MSMTANDIYTIAGVRDTVRAGLLRRRRRGDLRGDGCLGPFTIALASSDDLYIADYWNDRVREVIRITYKISTFAGNGTGIAAAGDGGPATGGELIQPEPAKRSTRWAMCTSRTRATTGSRKSPPHTHTQYGISMTGGDVYTVAGNYERRVRGHRRRRPGRRRPLLDDPTAIMPGHSGDLFIADEGNNRVQEVAAASGTQWGQSMTAGIFTRSPGRGGYCGTTGDGGAGHPPRCCTAPGPGPGSRR